MDAHCKLLMIRCVVSLSILNTLNIFTFHKLLTGTKMLKMFILSRSAFVIIFLRSCFLLSQRVRQSGQPPSLATLLRNDARSFLRPPVSCIRKSRRAYLKARFWDIAS